MIGDHVGAEWALAYGSVIALLTAAGAAVVLGRDRRLAAEQAAT